MATKGDISDLDEFIYGGEPIVPQLNGFSRRRKSGVVSSNTSGGLTRQRKKFYNQPYLVDCTYYLHSPSMQDFIKIFFERNEGKKFVAWLRADRAVLDSHVVQVVSDWEDSYASAVDGMLSVTLEVVSVRDAWLDDTLFDLYQLSGDDVINTTEGMEEIVRAMPEDS